MSGPDSAMEAEFDTVAAWTEQAVADLGRDHAVPAACRGSGSPADLAWLARGLDLRGDARFLDAGAGLGGPAAWLVDHLGGRWTGRPLLTEPMIHAARSARRLFGFPTVAAVSEALPLPSASVDVAWSLGVLCVTPSRPQVLGELRRVLVPGGRLGLLVLQHGGTPLPEQPEGNDFPTHDELAAQLADAGFRVDEEVDAARLPGAPAGWDERADRVDDHVRRHHREHPAHRQAEEQQRVMGRLLGERLVTTQLLVTTAV
ncbi:class I SAM-dependent methyltransferase [Actinomycetospora cinnamomea]|uniref:Ubiquinone/menaquinone biosynthesis C-methylase UbiE n=1 Tax=Actinomycetospora cinnamomea TaxID=663609 RepID=A0A2U1FQ07_9PSEU|nr:methyltransferase domain-containing protein [Actinomycetospora cinnamomea]PVZ14192.1 ubiquinone/menaquinone biosynthesis C-methylase UbiE [Actinomycetospora cinnamomea]